MKINIKNCARCEGDHDQLEFEAFTNPPGKETHFAMCPFYDEPILMWITIDIDVKVELPEVTS